MSIIQLERVTFAGVSADKDRLLDELHARGCLELIPLRNDVPADVGGGPSSEAREALKFLLACPQRRRQARSDARFDVQAIERQTLELRDRIHGLEAERDFLIQRLADIKPWGDFRFPALKDMDDLRLWFYVVPHKEMPKVEASGLTWELVRRDGRFCYVVVLDKTEPQSMPVPRVHLGSRSPEELQQRLDEVELAIEDAQAERASLTRWCLLFARDLVRLEDAAARAGAAQLTCDREPLFALQAWAPREQVPELADFAARSGFVFESTPPGPDDSPPTLMHNVPRVAIGEDLVNFYMTPGYWTWDPSSIVFVSFAVFFAMIMADAGYAAIMGLGLLALGPRLGRSAAGRRFRPLLTLIVVASLVYGVLVGSYFGFAPPEGSFLGRLHLLDMNNSPLMMGLSVLVGGLHVLLANVMDFRRYADWRDGLGSLGWAIAVSGGLLFAAGSAIPAVAVLKTLGDAAAVAGLLLVVGFTVTWIGQGDLRVNEPVARFQSNGEERQVSMLQRWPVRVTIPGRMLRRRHATRLYSEQPLITGTRIIDTFFPIACGGTGCIPGPFGAGKTVLQSTIARYSTVDVVVVVACGERAGEVVETITLYPETKDPRTGGTLMDRTIIICNTSSMPVAAREASIYMGITLAEYYRQMGLNVLLIADSTSRWAQAMRETSGRMEEIPGEEAFPAYLDSSIKSVYERAGVIRCPDGSQGSLTMIGTVSPAGGNFEEPVTQSTLGTVKTFLGLSYDRAYKRFYPAIDPLLSWSRYLDQLAPWLGKNLDPNWTRDVKRLHDLLRQGDSINQMMQVTGEEGITLEDYVTWQKSVLLDMAYLQQDAFDEVDACMPQERQLESLRLIKSLIDREYEFQDRDAAREFFTRVIGLYKNWNYSPPGSPEYQKYRAEIEQAAQQPAA